MVNNAPVRRYVCEVKKSIPCGGKQKRMILKQVNSSIREFVLEMPGCCYDDIIKRFGTPNQIAASYLEELDLADLKSQFSVRKRIICAVAAVGILVIGIWAGVVLYALHEYGDAMPGYIEVIVEVDEHVPVEGG